VCSLLSLKPRSPACAVALWPGIASDMASDADPDERGEAVPGAGVFGRRPPTFLRHSIDARRRGRAPPPRSVHGSVTFSGDVPFGGFPGPPGRAVSAA
jgi:hypothetical protein